MYRPALWALCSKVRLLTLTCLHDEVLGVYIGRLTNCSHDRKVTSNNHTFESLQVPKGQQAGIAAYQQAASKS